MGLAKDPSDGVPADATADQSMQAFASAFRSIDLALLAGAPHELMQPLLALAEPWAGQLKEHLAGAVLLYTSPLAL